MLTKVTLQISKEKIIVQKKGDPDLTIHLADIETIKLNIGKPNTVEFIGASNHLLFRIFALRTRKNWQQELTDSLASFLHLQKEVKSKKTAFRNYESALYTKS